MMTEKESIISGWEIIRTFRIAAASNVSLLVG